jgi:hypothetical protein
MQIALLAGTLTAAGVIGGIALQHGGNQNLLLLIPPLASATAIVYREQSRRIAIYGHYIERVLWPYLAEHTDPDLPSWQAYWRLRSRPLLVTLEMNQMSGLLILLGIAALAARHKIATGAGAYQALWWLDAVLIVMAITFTPLTWERPPDPSEQVSTSSRK